MERIQVLIRKLNEQLEQQAGAAQMLLTVQMLQAELSRQQTEGKQILGTSKVAVVLPKPAAVPAYASADLEKYAPKVADDQPVEEIKEVQPVSGKGPQVKKQHPENLLFDPMLEIPTLSQQMVKEVNELAADKQLSLNDRLKQQKTELGEVLKESPIKDLRKAIGINDRFVFINDLFRGDEPMYERSIKTINSFHIFAEAEYWINRELIVKLGWDEENEIVRHFYLLVKRRFS